MEFIIWVSREMFSAKHPTLFIVATFIFIGDAMLAILHCMTYPIPKDMACLFRLFTTLIIHTELKGGYS